MRVRKQTIVRKVEIGIPTLNDILDELAKPGRDPREKFEVFAFADGMADKFVKNPADIVKVQQKVMVSVLNVDLARNRISLTMKSQAEKSET